MATQRVACLYRVSTKGQVDKNDIPMQRKECHTFIEKNSDWVFTKEYFEKGVSGFKKTAAQRDVLQQVKQDAFNKEFDILLVFMFDRLGRKEDETPFVVEWFSKQGIEVWSVIEGQQKFEQHVDKLINYIRFWQSSGESEKTSIRVDTKHVQMAQEGIFRGGSAPYGYTLIQSGNVNKKGKPLMRLQIDEKQSEIIKTIYDYVLNYGYGKSRIAQLLNQSKIPSSTGGTWNSSVIGYIIKNPIYKGYPTYRKKTCKSGQSHNLAPDDWILPSDQVQELVIIDEKQWNLVQKIKQSNINKKDICNNEVQNKITKSPLLFVGIIKCGYCGSPLTTTYNYRYDSNKALKKCIAKYRCSGKAIKKIDCEGQVTYTQNKIEDTVIAEVVERLKTIYKNPLPQKQESKKLSMQKLQKNNKLIFNTQKEYNVLLQEVSKSLLGESRFSTEILSGLIKQKETDLKIYNQNKEEIENELQNEKQSKTNYKVVKDIVDNWNDYFNSMDYNRKKMFLRQFVKQITVYKDYIHIEYNDIMSGFINPFILEKDKRTLL